MLEGSFTSRQSELLSRLVALAEERVSSDAVTEERYSTASRTATGERDDALDRAQRQEREESQAEEQRHKSGLREAEARGRGATQALQDAYQDELDGIRAKAARNEQEARKKMDEAIWLAETVFEAGEEKPSQRFAAIEKSLDTQRTQLQSLARDARDRVLQYRQKSVLQEAESFDGEAPDFGDADIEDVIEGAMNESRDAAMRVHRLKLARLFRGGMLPCLAILVLGATAGITGAVRGFTIDGTFALALGGAAAGFALLAAGCYALARSQVRGRHRAMSASVHRAMLVIDHALEAAATRQAREERELAETRDRDIAKARSTYEPIIEQIAERRDHHVARIEAKYPERIEAARADAAEAMTDEEERHTAAVAEVTERATRNKDAATKLFEERRAVYESKHDEERGALVSAWMTGMTECAETVRTVISESARLFPEWDDPQWETWSPPMAFAPSVRFGCLAVDRHHIPGSVPEDPTLAIDMPDRFTLPATLDFPDNCSLLLETDGAGREEAVAALQAVMLRLLTAVPPGKVRFTIVDPVSLGQNFAGFMHLGDYDEAFVTSRIWTEPRHIEQRLTDITEHMENVIQKYLRNEFETIADYNEQAGEIAEPYRFLVISDLPTNFTDTAIKRLASIVSSGPRCGVYTLIHVDKRLSVPPGLRIEDIEARSTTIAYQGDRFVWKNDTFKDLPLTIERFPDETFVNKTLHAIGAASKDATRVEVPFKVISPAPEDQWSRDCGSALSVPLGKSGATKLQELIVGPGTSQHVLIAGKTGSGKSTLLHVIVTNLALWYSPDEVQFYLVDFKKGVEFKTYATNDLPHAIAVAVESDREFGLSVLQRIDTELKRRGDKYRELGVQDLAGCRAASGEPMPRVLLVIDEFQELFVEDDKIGQDAALLMDRIVRQGRAFGIHVLLGSQTLGGAYTLARSTIGQMQVRIALQCSEADSYLILSDDNSAARLLARPGEAIYNDAGGRLEGNSPFQICWLPDPVRDESLAKARDLATERGWKRTAPQIVFEGNVPADPGRNHLLSTALETMPTENRATTVWLGEAIAIKGPTEAVFRRQSGRNLLIVGQQDEPALAMSTTALVALAAQCNPTENGSLPQIWLLDGTPADAPGAGELERALGDSPVQPNVVGWRDVETSMATIAEEVERRTESREGVERPIFLLVHGLHRFRMLRASDDFGFSMDEKPASADQHFANILRDGPPVGVHTIAWCDTAVNLNRTLDRQGLREFEMRALFQMSGADSTQLIDSPLAAKVGMQRALFYDEESGVLEKFQPYSLPTSAWLDEVRRQLASR